jgi:hypothetical protein
MTDTSNEAVENVANSCDVCGDLFDAVECDDLEAGPEFKRAAATLRALLAERDAARAEVTDVLAENDALRFDRNNLRAEAQRLREARGE